VPGLPPGMNVGPMKKTKMPDGGPAVSDDLLAEYQFDYRKARPNRFAGRVDRKPVMVALDPDVAEVFTSSESVNAVLRALITSMPKSS
jgi:hypothetical protein